MITEKKVKVKETGLVVMVYKLKNGNWCNSNNCTTEYKESEIQAV
jgi:hypothetical protein